MAPERRGAAGRASAASTAVPEEKDKDEDEPEKSRKPKDTPFRQQTVKAWVPVLQPRLVMALFMIIGIIFVPVGVYLRAQSNSIVEYKAKYDGKGAQAALASCAVTDFGVTGSCNVSFNIQERMDPPIYVYYELTNLLQNHRRYVKSRSAPQLVGDSLLPDTNCDPLRTTPNGTALNPCGLVANSFFTDSFTLSSSSGTATAPVMSETGIAWAVDRSDRFAQPKGFRRNLCAAGTCESCLGSGAYTTENPCKLATYEGSRWAYWYPSDDTIQYLYESYPDNISPVQGVENEHFMVWMRTAGLPNFKKLYGRIETPLKAGSTVTFAIAARYYVTGFKGTKSLVLSTVSRMGGKNEFIGAAYIALGALSLAIALAFAVKHWTNPRKLGDTRFLVMQDTE